MAELMEEGLHLSQCQQGRFLVSRFREIHHHTDVRPYILHIIRSEGLLHVLTLHPLALVFRHPGTSLLTLAGMEVGIKDGEIRTVLVEHLVGFHVRMIDRDILVFLECDAVETIGKTKHATNDLRQLEIRAQHLCIDVISLQLQLMGVV